MFFRGSGELTKQFTVKKRDESALMQFSDAVFLMGISLNVMQVEPTPDDHHIGSAPRKDQNRKLKTETTPVTLPKD